MPKRTLTIHVDEDVYTFLTRGGLKPSARLAQIARRYDDVVRHHAPSLRPSEWWSIIESIPKLRDAPDTDQAVRDALIGDAPAYDPPRFFILDVAEQVAALEAIAIKVDERDARKAAGIGVGVDL